MSTKPDRIRIVQFEDSAVSGEPIYREIDRANDVKSALAKIAEGRYGNGPFALLQCIREGITLEVPEVKPRLNLGTPTITRSRKPKAPAAQEA